MVRQEVNKLIKKGLSQSGISKIIGVSRQRVWQIINNYKSKGSSRLSVLNNGICDTCGDYGDIERHHINKNSRDNKRNNIMFLCVSCHKKEHVRLRKKVIKSN